MFKVTGKFGSILLLFAVVVLGYAQVSFGTAALKWDLIDVVFPFRYFFSESVGAGYFPFWNPFIQTGTPFYADLQAPTYYPELWLVSILGGYTVYTMHLLMILYLFLASVGMYGLVKDYTDSESASIFAGLTYAFSGFMVGHGQHFFLIVGAAWIPFVIRSYVTMCHSGKSSDAVRAALFTFLLLTGAYQALSLVMFYLLMGVFVYLLVDRVRSNEPIIPLLKVNALFTGLTVVMCLPLINATIEIIPLVDRLSGGVGLEKTLGYGQPAAGLISLLVPYVTISFEALFDRADVALLNHYVGLVPLVFFLLALTKRQPTWVYLVLVFGLLVFSMSFGFLPVRQWVYAAIPFMDLFLLAAYVRVFGTVVIIGLSARYLAELDEKIDRDRAKLVALALFMIIGLCAVLWVVRTGGKNEGLDAESMVTLTTQVALSIGVLLSMILVVAKYRSIGSPKVWIVLILIVDLVSAAQWNLSTTVVNVSHTPSVMQHDLDRAPKGFPLPVNSKVVYNDEQHAFFAPFWRNTHIFSKQVSFESFSSFKLRSYNLLDEQHPDLRDRVIDNHLVYRSDSIGRISELEKGVMFNAPASLLYLSDEDFDSWSELYLRSSSTDDVQIKEFTPNRVGIETQSQYDQILTLLQSNYQGWRAYIDGEEVPLRTSNFNYRSVLLPSGTHEVVFSYSNPRQLFFYFLSNGVFTLLVLWLTVKTLRIVNDKKIIYFGLPVLFVLILTSFALVNIKRPDTSTTVHEQNRARFAADAVKQWQNNFEELDERSNSSQYVSGSKSLYIDPSVETHPLLRYTHDPATGAVNTLFVSFEMYIQDYPEAFLVSEIDGDWHAMPLSRQVERLNQWNTVQYVRSLPTLHKGSEIKIYLWNPKGHSFSVDEATVVFSEK